MFDPSSRYANIDTATYCLKDGTVARYVKRRFLPQGETLPLLAQVRTVQGDRLDLISFRILGDPLAFWRIADANNAINPFDAVAGIDVQIRIPMPI